MGINLSIYRDGWREHPDWDWGRCSGDRDVLRIMKENGGITRKQVGHPMDGDYLERPKDPDKFERAMIEAHPENADRWRELARIMRNPEWWIYVSI